MELVRIVVAEEAAFGAVAVGRGPSSKTHRLGRRVAKHDLACHDENGVDETIVVTLGKRIGLVTWRLVAPVPPFD